MAGNWSNGVPGTAGASTTDVANLSNLTTTQTIIYDASASGFLGSLDMIQATNKVVTTLVLSRSLTLTTGTSYLYGLSSPGGNEVISLGTNTLTVGTGATLSLGDATAVNPVGGGASLANLSGSAGSSVVVDGTLLVTESASSTGIFNTYINSNLTIDSTGTLQVSSNAASGTRFDTLGSFTTVGNAALVGAGSVPNGNGIFFSGATNTFSSGTTFTGFAASALLFAAPTTGQTTASAALLPAFAVRDVNSGSSTTETFSSTATSGAIGNAVNSIQLINGLSSATSIFKLGSNLNLASGSTPFTYSWNGATTSGLTANVQNVDLNGFTYDATTAAVGSFTPTAMTAGHTQANIVNSGASSISGGQGIFRSGLFFLSSSDMGIGAGVILQSTAASGTNNLGVMTGGVTTIDPTSTFYYTGAGTLTTPGFITSNRAIGNIVVGDGVNASALVTSTAPLVAAGTTTINANSTLDAHSTATLTTAGLIGLGTLTNASPSGSTTVTINATGTNTFSGKVTDSQGSTTLSFILGSGSTGTQVFSGTTSNFRGTTAVNGGTLLVTGKWTGAGAITVNSGGAFGGAGGTITTGTTTVNGVTIANGGRLSVSGGGTVTAGTLTLALGSGALDLSAAVVQAGELNFVLGSNAGTSDQIVLSSATSTLNIGSSLLSLSDFLFGTGSTFGAGTYVLFDTHSASGITGSLAAAGLTGTLNGYNVTLSEGVDGNGFQDIVLIAAVPEPSALLLLLPALLLFGFVRRRTAA